MGNLPLVLSVIFLCLSAGCIAQSQSTPDPDILVRNSADFSIEYTIEVQNESGGLVFSNTTTIEPKATISYVDIIDDGRYEASITFDDGTEQRYGWEKTGEGHVLRVTLRGKDASFDGSGGA